MIKYLIKAGLTLSPVISGISSLNETSDFVYLPALLAVVGVLPIAAAWVKAFVEGAECISNNDALHVCRDSVADRLFDPYPDNIARVRE